MLHNIYAFFKYVAIHLSTFCVSIICGKIHLSLPIWICNLNMCSFPVCPADLKIISVDIPCIISFSLKEIMNLL